MLEVPLFFRLDEVCFNIGGFERMRRIQDGVGDFFCSTEAGNNMANCLMGLPFERGIQI